MARNKASDQKKILRYLGETPIREFACRKAGVSRATFYRWLDEDVEFSRAVGKALIPGRDRVTDLAESKLFEAIQRGEPWAIKYWLNNNCDRYNAYANQRRILSHDEILEMKPIEVMGTLKGPNEG